MESFDLVSITQSSIYTENELSLISTDLRTFTQLLHAYTHSCQTWLLVTHQHSQCDENVQS